MEELLNKLIEKGRKPRWLTIMWKIRIEYDIEFAFEIYDSFQKWHWNFRELVSKESWLWQFVCENGMVDGVDRWTLNARQKSIYDKYITSEKEYTPKMNYEYRLIEASLKDESELESFILDNVKVEW